MSWHSWQSNPATNASVPLQLRPLPPEWESFSAAPASYAPWLAVGVLGIFLLALAGWTLRRWRRRSAPAHSAAQRERLFKRWEDHVQIGDQAVYLEMIAYLTHELLPNILSVKEALSTHEWIDRISASAAMPNDFKQIICRHLQTAEQLKYAPPAGMVLDSRELFEALKNSLHGWSNQIR